MFCFSLGPKYRRSNIDIGLGHPDLLPHGGSSAHGFAFSSPGSLPLDIFGYHWIPTSQPFCARSNFSSLRPFVSPLSPLLASKPSPERFWKGFTMVCCLVCCCCCCCLCCCFWARRGFWAENQEICERAGSCAEETKSIRR